MDQKYVDSPSKLDSQNSIFKTFEDRGSRLESSVETFKAV